MIWYYDSLWISKKWNVIQKNMGMRANCGSSMITGNWLFNQPVLCPNQTWRWGQFRAIPSKFPGRDKWTQSNWFSSSPQLVTGSFGEVLVFPISMANLRCQQHRFHEYIFLDMVPIVEATTSLRTSSTQGFPSWKIVVSPVTRLEGPTPNFWVKFPIPTVYPKNTCGFLMDRGQVRLKSSHSGHRPSCRFHSSRGPRPRVAVYCSNIWRTTNQRYQTMT